MKDLGAKAFSYGYASPAEQFVDAPPDLNDLPVKNPSVTYFVRAAG